MNPLSSGTSKRRIARAGAVSELILHPAERRMRPVFDFDPAIGSPAAAPGRMTKGGAKFRVVGGRPVWCAFRLKLDIPALPKVPQATSLDHLVSAGE
jgi:hypothetical protein